MKKFLSLLLILGICSCAGGGEDPALVDMPAVMGGLQDDISRSYSLPLTGLEYWSPLEKLDFVNTMMNQQCRTQRGDPTFITTIGDTTLTLNGTYQRGAHVDVGNVSQLQAASFKVDVNKGDNQTLQQPVSVVALSMLPDVIYGKRAQYLQVGGMDPKVKQELVNDRAYEQKFVGMIIKDYSPQACAHMSVAKRSTVFLGTKWRRYEKP